MGSAFAVLLLAYIWLAKVRGNRHPEAQNGVVVIAGTSVIGFVLTVSLAAELEHEASRLHSGLLRGLATLVLIVILGTLFINSIVVSWIGRHQRNADTEATTTWLLAVSAARQTTVVAVCGALAAIVDLSFVSVLESRILSLTALSAPLSPKARRVLVSAMLGINVGAAAAGADA
jgi:hypothetical protein